MRLFPRFENVGYADSFMESWEAQRRVRTDKHFDTYFRMSIGDETLPLAEIDEFIGHAGDGEYVKRAFRKALGVIRKNGKSKVPLLLDELNVHAVNLESEVPASLFPRYSKSLITLIEMRIVRVAAFLSVTICESTGLFEN